ncbi:MAG TPA: universal stress protein [Rhizomicrobium sp.]|nr:universal stress protein [Rhizomicrobium sp.]
MTVKKILLPVSPAVPFERVVAQAIRLAVQCGAELFLLHVGSPTWDVDDGVPEGVAVRRLAVAGEPVRQIAAAARLHSIDLIMMATHEKWRAGDGTDDENDFLSFLRQSVVARIVEMAPCAVWVDTGQSMTETAVHRPLCYLDLRPRSASTFAKAGSFAAAIGAPLTVAHATFSTEIHAPGGGSLTAGMWQESFAETATEKFQQLQRQLGTDAELMIENGEPLKVVPRLITKAEADLLIVGHWAVSERWGRGGQWNDESDVCRMIRRSRVPVLIFKGEAPLAPRREPAPSAPSRLIADMVILLPMILILVAALAVGFRKAHPAHTPVTQVHGALLGREQHARNGDILGIAERQKVLAAFSPQAIIALDVRFWRKADIGVTRVGRPARFSFADLPKRT